MSLVAQTGVQASITPTVRARISRTFALLGVLCAFLATLGAPSALAADPNHVSFTLEGCRLQTTSTLPNGDGDFICADSEYTTGNLGKNWNELDLVPYRLTADNGNGAQTYTIAIAVDKLDAGHPGYDVISVPVLNTDLSSGTCTLTASGEKTMSPGLGGMDETLYREVTITQSAGATCVWDYYARLALGSHLFPGSSLHANLGLIVDSDEITTSGIGARDVSIPVKEILPQELTKTMSATQGSAYTWSVSKSSNPSSLNFGNTCATTAAERQRGVTITVTWTRTAPSATGDITIVTDVYATNPAHRVITVSVQDKIYKGTAPNTAADLIDTKNGSPVDVPADTSNFLVLHHVKTVPAGTATEFNDVATATYTDKVTGIPVPGTTEATASASVVLNNANNGTATITDTEQITGTGLSFSVDSTSGASGAFSGYTLGTHTTGPVSWTSGNQSGSGSATFNKTVYLDQPRATTGTLSDTATVDVLGGVGHAASASASTGISSTLECGDITIIKDAVPNAAQDFGFTSTSNQSTGIGSFSLDDDADGTLPNSRTFSGLKPGNYTVSESLPVAGWRLTGLVCDDGSPQDPDTGTASIALAGLGHVTCTFTNTRLVTSLEVVKSGTPDVVHDGDLLTFTYEVSNPASNTGSVFNVALSDDKCDSIEGPLTKTGGNQDNALDPGETWTYRCTTTAKHEQENANHDIINMVTATGEDEEGNPLTDTDDEITHVIHPAIGIVKTGPATAQAGQPIVYAIDVTNTGDTPFAAATVVVNDPRCDGAPQLVSKNGDASEGSLDPGDRWSYTCTASTQVGDTNVHNVADVTGSDQLGKSVTASDDADTTLTQPAQLVLPERIVPGSARLLGPTGCVGKVFQARVRGTKIARVVFRLDGKVVKRLTKPNQSTAFAFRVDTKKLRIGVHRLVATITFQAGSGTKPKTLRLSFQRCARKLVAPRFTG
jgi:hypothetical protein